jgi:hypothetical protein
MDLAALKAGVADVQVKYRGSAFSVGYRPEMVNEDDLSLLEAFSDKSGVALLKATVAPVTRLVTRWDLTLGQEPLAVSEEAITALPPRMRVAILEAIMADFFDSGNAAPSNAGLSTPAVLEGTAQTTPPSSGMQNGPASLPGTSSASLSLVGA